MSHAPSYPADKDCCIHCDVVQQVQEELPSEEFLDDLAELSNVFRGSTRIKVLYALLDRELCVGDLAQVLNVSQSAVSHQLRILKQFKLVKFRRQGKTIFYSLDDDHVRSILSMGAEHVEE